MTSENWSPTDANTYMNLTWDRENTSLNSDQVVLASLTLSASLEIESINDFNFNIIITGVNQ